MLKITGMWSCVCPGVQDGRVPFIWKTRECVHAAEVRHTLFLLHHFKRLILIYLNLNCVSECAYVHVCNASEGLNRALDTWELEYKQL